MHSNKEKLTAISELHGSVGAPAVQSILKLIDISIDEVRLMNDEATATEFVVNQGEIKGLKKLKEYIEKGLPSI